MNFNLIVSDDKNLTPFEKLLHKRKEKKKQRKLKNKQKTDEEKSDSDGNSSDDIPSDVDMNDPYFAEEFNKPEFKNKKSKTKTQSQKEDDQNSSDEDKRKAELELLIDEDDGKQHFSLKKIQEAENISKKSKRKRKLKEKIKQQNEAVPDFEINLEDNRFAALYESHLFNIDPTDPNFKKTKNMEKLIQEKLKRRPTDDPVPEHKSKKSKEDAELNVLVKNIKRKTKDVVRK